MTLGEMIIDELGRRGQRGMYFSFASYQRLRQVQNDAELRSFFASERFEDAPNTTSPQKIVDFMDAATKAVTGQDLMFFFALGVIGKLDPALEGLPVFYMAYVTLRRRRPRRFLSHGFGKSIRPSTAR